jgi:hypothetical protein
MIPELFNTDITFYMIRYWGRKILRILSILHENYICVKYLTLNDFYISRDGRDIKLRNIEHLSIFKPNSSGGKIYFGPDLNFILCFYKGFYKENDNLYNNNNKNFEEEKSNNNNNNMNNLNQNPKNYDIEKKLHFSLLEICDYDDGFIAPEFIKKDAKEMTYKIDTWVFGSILYNILFGKPPKSYISQLKDWCNNQTNLIFEKISFPFDIASKHFFYNCFFNEENENNSSNKMNINSFDINNKVNNNNKNNNEDENNNINNFLENSKKIKTAIGLNSYSAIVNEKHLNPETESKNKINGLGMIYDLITTCLNPNDEKRPDILDLIKTDLFKFDNYEMILVNKFAYNTLRYLSPDGIIIKNILLPLREVSNLK